MDDTISYPIISSIILFGFIGAYMIHIGAYMIQILSLIYDLLQIIVPKFARLNMIILIL